MLWYFNLQNRKYLKKKKKKNLLTRQQGLCMILSGKLDYIAYPLNAISIYYYMAVKYGEWEIMTLLKELI